MRKVKRIVVRTVDRLGEQGSALLVSLMVMVGLSLLGLGFVAMSETESAIAINERNALQVLAVAETGAKTVVEWFQDPRFANNLGQLPPNTNAIKVERALSTAAAPTTYSYVGRYKAGVGAVLFDRPLRDNDGKFFGTEDNPDILINDFTAGPFLADFNIRLFNNVPIAAGTGTAGCGGCDNREVGRVTEIRVYAPPTNGSFQNAYAGWTAASGGIPPASGFLGGGARYGVATIRVTAIKYQQPNCGPYVNGCRALAQRTVKMVIAEWPVPGPGGPVQSATSLQNAGNVHVHWGRSTSDGPLNLTKSDEYDSIPWHDAYNIANFERGYDPNLFPVPGPVPADYKQTKAWFNEIVGRTFPDPWWGARARGTITQLGGALPHPVAYDAVSVITDPTTQYKTAMFQVQTKSDGVNYREVLFPRIDYNFWKQVARASSDQTNIKYLRWTAGQNYADPSGCTQAYNLWIDTNTVSACHGGQKAPAGFYFFDTKDGANPQLVPNPTNLTPQIDGFAGLMRGFMYFNTVEFKTTGAAGTPNYYNMPGEPFRDVGYRRVETNAALAWYRQGARTDPAVPCVWTPANAIGTGCIQTGAGDGRFSYQDLPFSNGAVAANGVFDVNVALNPVAIARLSGAPLAANSTYVVRPYVPGCVPGNNSCGACNCSEPHEPYLNMVYPAAVAGSNPTPVTVRWNAPATPGQAKLMNGAVPIACNAASPQTDCTSNAYDRDGALVSLSTVLDGVLYIEGKVSTTGNAFYFGSVLMRGEFSVAGNPDVFFDERLIKDDWPPASMNFPRVYVSTIETEQ